MCVPRPLHTSHVPDARLPDPPTITLHGTKDVLVPFRLAEQLTAALEKAGVRAELVRKLPPRARPVR